jgi:hypothetical protein
MTTSKNTLIDIDAEFDDVYFDEASINHATAILNRDANPDYHFKRNSSLKEVYKDPVWQENIQKGADKRHSDPNWEKSWRDSYTPESNQRRSESMKIACKDPNLKAIRSSNSKEMWKNPERRQKTQKCVKTSLGVFISCVEAAIAHGITRGAFSNLMRRNIDRNNFEFGYISIEEYIMLTGKDI